jgi:hypothetical protein
MKLALKVLSALLISAVIVTGFRSQIHGGLRLNLAFWLPMLAGLTIRAVLSQRRYWVRRGLVLTGAYSNAIVILANGGYMPVSEPTIRPYGVWVQLNASHHLILLADINHCSSVGDMLIVSGILMSFGYWVAGKVKKQLGIRRRARYDEQVRRLVSA